MRTFEVLLSLPGPSPGLRPVNPQVAMVNCSSGLGMLKAEVEGVIIFCRYDVGESHIIEIIECFHGKLSFPDLCHNAVQSYHWKNLHDSTADRYSQCAWKMEPNGTKWNQYLMCKMLCMAWGRQTRRVRWGAPGCQNVWSFQRWPQQGQFRAQKPQSCDCSHMLTDMLY